MTYPRPVPVGTDIGFDVKGRRINRETGNFILTAQDGSLFEVVTTGIRLPVDPQVDPQVKVGPVQAGAPQYVPLKGANVQFQRGELVNPTTGNPVAMTKTGKMFEISNVQAGAAQVASNNMTLLYLFPVIVAFIIFKYACDLGYCKVCRGVGNTGLVFSVLVLLYYAISAIIRHFK